MRSKLETYKTRALVIGSGCAGLNGADCLYEGGITDVILATEGMTMGTSRNTGSDKQTYYKLSLTHDVSDSVGRMAESYFAGGAMSGELALCESANSLACFFKLCRLGVPFPKNSYGEYVGYQTDHDDTKRATSAGPLTSKYMTEALERAVLAKGITILDGVLIFRLFKNEEGICGALGYRASDETFVLVETPHILLATGGSAALYRDSVFPVSQTGMSGMAYDLGATTANLTEWQYGLASVDFRWNVSGTYQQVLPRYISVDAEGNAYEFLADALSLEEMLLYIFRKGYQWPFDSRKADASSKVDTLVRAELALGRQVYMDFMHNPRGYAPSVLPKEAYDYLAKSEALQDTPIARLRAMNEKAYRLYLDNGIDLEREMLRVAVCAQHQNGGLQVDKHYRTDIPGLYAVGEAAGVFGVYRPGGSALNSTQVSSMRAADHIVQSHRTDVADLQEAAEAVIDGIRLSEAGDPSFYSIREDLQRRMSLYGAFSRDREQLARLQKDVSSYLATDLAVSRTQLPDYLRFRDLLLTLHEVLPAMLLWCDAIGARGSAVSVGAEVPDDTGRIVCTRGGEAYLTEAASIPESVVWFERIYNGRE